jgi:hypothetical protein
MTEPQPYKLQLANNDQGYPCQLCRPKDQREEPTRGTKVLYYRAESMSTQTRSLALCPQHRAAVANALLGDYGIIPARVALVISHLVQNGFVVLITSVTPKDVLFSIDAVHPAIVRDAVQGVSDRYEQGVTIYEDADKVFGSWESMKERE